jgi:RHS repeat-associated protein
MRLAAIIKVGGVEKIYYYVNDHLGTPRKVVDETGSITWAADHTPFGQATGTLTNNFRFSGQYFDSETGLHYNYHRYYDPKIGRYFRPDPIGLEGMDPNLYGYVQNNPINHIDPEGLTGLVGLIEHVLQHLIIEKAADEYVEIRNERIFDDVVSVRGEIRYQKKVIQNIIKRCDDECILNNPTDECNREKCHAKCTKRMVELRRELVDPLREKLRRLDREARAPIIPLFYDFD